MIKFTQTIFIFILVIINLECKTYQYGGRNFETENEMNEFIKKEKEEKSAELKMKAAEERFAKEEDSAFKFFIEKFGENEILDLRIDNNKVLLSEAYFNQYGNPSVNKYKFENEFEYNRKKNILSQIKKKKYLFIKGQNMSFVDYNLIYKTRLSRITDERMSLSEYDFKEGSYTITWINVSLPFPRHSLQFKFVDIPGYDTWDIGGYYEIKNEPKFKIKADLAESFYKKFKSGYWNVYAILEVLETKDANAGIKCGDLINTLFNGKSSYEKNYHIMPTCVSEKWEKLIVRTIETKIVGYYIVTSDEVYKNIIK